MLKACGLNIFLCMNSADLGRMGEEHAARYFSDNGFRILHRNHRIGRSEVDLIIQDAHKVVFVEIKTRSGIQPLREDEMITSTKRRALLRAADFFLNSMPEETEIRFDLVLINYHQNRVIMKHIEDAFRDAGDFYDL